MAQSMNTKVDLTIDATSYFGVLSYGKVMVGDKAFEYYNDRNVNDYIQIPWTEVDYIAASVILKGKWISRFAIFTKNNGNYSFSSKDNKKLLRAVNKYIPSEKLVKSDSFFQVISRSFKRIINK
ncbi:DUF956 family protein [Peptostreptococcus canis]|uniref:DUF956 family protein n=1 Tax=Peptostreptococcus canis TaxID=1159213 RepID=A0ABR6TIA8_9FIRM|nr:DUF956 family protein [Peptostreptococcus canis]MBC2575127.1 DUF956 family protein [Peptostreptococcus canis]MBP1997699.1 hypothetical protein [Peptostreptococcus canis]